MVTSIYNSTRIPKDKWDRVFRDQRLRAFYHDGVLNYSDVAESRYSWFISRLRYKGLTKSEVKTMLFAHAKATDTTMHGTIVDMWIEWAWQDSEESWNRQQAARNGRKTLEEKVWTGYQVRCALAQFEYGATVEDLRVALDGVISNANLWQTLKRLESKKFITRTATGRYGIYMLNQAQRSELCKLIRNVRASRDAYGTKVEGRYLDFRRLVCGTDKFDPITLK